MVETTPYTIKALDETTWDAFAALVERNNGVFGGCWCIGFQPEGGDKKTTPALNRQRKLERVRDRKAHAALVFDGDNCLGWCQFGTPGGCRLRARRLPLQRRAVDLRAARLHPRPQDRQAPLGRDQARRTERLALTLARLY